MKVIITSATIEPERFARHFATATDTVPIIEVSGRTYPVELRYRPPETGTEQTAAIDAAVSSCGAGQRRHPGLLPTERDIRDTAKALAHREAPGAEIVPLYARLSIGEQRRVFTRPMDAHRIGDERRRDIADGARHPLRRRHRNCAHRGTHRGPRSPRPPIEPVSQASARQRAGAVGASRPVSASGSTTRPTDTETPTPTREILRANLAGVILSMVSLRLGDIAEFGFVSPPVAAGDRRRSGRTPGRTGRDRRPPRRAAEAHRRREVPGPSADRPRPARMLVTAHELAHGRRPGGRRGAIHPRRAVASGGQAGGCRRRTAGLTSPDRISWPCSTSGDYAEEMRARNCRATSSGGGASANSALDAAAGVA